MTKAPLWTRRFFAIIIANGLLFASFHCLLPTLPLYVASLGASGAEIGLISGIFGVSAIFIRFFTDDFVKLLGKKKCLYLGLFFSLISTVAYAFFTSIHMLLIARVVQGWASAWARPLPPPWPSTSSPRRAAAKVSAISG